MQNATGGLTFEEAVVHGEMGVQRALSLVAIPIPDRFRKNMVNFSFLLLSGLALHCMYNYTHTHTHACAHTHTQLDHH